MHSAAKSDQIDFSSRGIAAARVRYGLLLGVSFTTAALVSMAAAPGASAQSAGSFCTQTGTTANCGPGTTTAGITYSPNQPTFHLTFAPNTVVNTANGNAVSISTRTAAVSFDAPDTTVLRVGSSGIDGIYVPSSISANVNFGGLLISEAFHGIDVSAASDVTIASASSARIHSASTGILAQSANGGIMIANAGTIIQGASTVSSPVFGTVTILPNAAADGISAAAGGTGAITIANTGAITSQRAGIVAGAQGGSVQVSNGGTVTAPFGLVGVSLNGPLTATNSGALNGATVGIVGGSQTGSVEIMNAISGRITFGAFGLAGGTNSGDVTITNAGTLLQDSTLPKRVTQEEFDSTFRTFGDVRPKVQAGVFGRSESGNLTIANSGSIVGTYGMYSESGRAGRISVANTGSVTAGFGGVYAETNSGSVDISNRGTITARFAGVIADSGSFTLTNESTGSIAAPFGILAKAEGMASVTNAGTIRAGGGVALLAPAATVNNSGSLTFGQIGIAAAGGTVAITNAGALTYDSSIANALTPGAEKAIVDAVGPELAKKFDQLPAVGIAAVAQRDLTIANSGTIRTSAAGYGIAAEAGSVTIRNLGTIGGSGTAIIAKTFGGPLSITNEVGGRILGSIVNLDGAATSQVDNRPGVGNAVPSVGTTFTNRGTFAATGTSTFGSGTIGNAGTIALARDATLGSLSSFTNEGIVQGPAGGSARIATTTFVNAGAISLQNGAAGDTLTIAGNYVGRNGRVDLDVSSQSGTADRLVITGNAGGTTGLNLLNVTPGAAFTVSPVLVQVRGEQEANAFTLASARNFGAIDVSLASGRATEGGSTLSLVSVPNALGQSGPTTVIAARTIAFQGGTAVLDRMTQLRSDVQRAAGSAPTAIPQALQYAGLTQYSALVSKDPIAPNLVQPAPVPASNVKPAVWARAFGDLERRTGFSSGSFNGVNVGRDLGYSQSTGGVLAGADLVMSGITAPDDGLILGVLGGYTTAAVRLNQNAGNQDYEGGTVGTYATYIKGGFFADAMFKVDLLDLDITGSNLRQNTGVTNYDVLGNIGYRFDLPNALYIEPTAGLEYVSTVFSRKTGGTAGTIALQDGDAFRGRIGARLGTEFVQDDIRVEPSITGLVYDVFSESGTTTAFGSGTRLTGLTNVGKVRGEIQASMNFFNLKTGVSGFLRADYRIGDDLVGGGGKAGIRYQW
ncbi:autotransporter outer membrane beta-barrel domain-containing protein [Methylobacterium sp. Leaf93]|uniref:autotransporter outer membrane beta-barrel domain-containing protein n=1 Tax=Methylobacterium sp. Leaf93 TaxID=1736249 RepID=UPI00138F3F94|nr:autotransporter outer membrane beta-barrel domain-containing protein [Methylobacterium sp. Leaf93]